TRSVDLDPIPCSCHCRGRRPAYGVFPSGSLPRTRSVYHSSTMQRSQSLSAAGLFALAVVVFAGGCASGQMSRIDRNRDIYESWPLEVKQAVLDGKVEPGMNSDMVRVAWGEPTEVTTSQAGDEI